MSTQDLKQLLSEHPERVVVVTGAGVTLGALEAGAEAFGRASWKGLIEHGLAFAQERRALTKADVGRLEALLGSERASLWIAAAECLSEALGAPRGGDFNEWLRRSVGDLADAIGSRAVLDVLVDLEQRGAVLATVNYDGVLEAATGCPPVTWREPAKVQRVLRGDARGILHLHGYWEDPESVVLGSTSYATVITDRHARAALESMAMMRTLVFLGHGAGLDDPNWSSLLEWMSEVLARGPYQHYRIVREEELATYDDPRLSERRIALVSFDGGHDRFAPFLRELVPAGSGDVEAVEPTLRSVLLLVNIGGHDHEPVTLDDARRAATVENFSAVLEVAVEFEPSGATAQEWGSVRAELDRLVKEAQASAGDDVCFVLAGRAPLPVFCYLGFRTQRLTGDVLMISHHGGRWHRIGPFADPSQFPVGAENRFTLLEPPPGEIEEGKNAVFVACSSNYRCSPADLRPVVGDNVERITALCTVRSNKDLLDPMTEADLAPLSELFAISLRVLTDAAQRGRGLVLAFGGPAWAAFWLGRQINRKAVGDVDFPNYVPEQGYVPALDTGQMKG